MADDTYNWQVTISASGRRRPYVRVVRASTIKPSEAVHKVFQMIENEEDHWLWQEQDLKIECKVVS